MNVRLQLSLFVPPHAGAQLEAVRRVLDPVQAGLIPAHVTLCREDELGDLPPAALRSKLAAAEARPITLCFGPPEAFQGHGVLLPCVAGEAGFFGLREWLLGTDAARRQVPHITLAHPRNPRSASHGIEHASQLLPGLAITFAAVCRIEQQGSGPWRVLDRYALAGDGRRPPTA